MYAKETYSTKGDFIDQVKTILSSNGLKTEPLNKDNGIVNAFYSPVDIQIHAVTFYFNCLFAAHGDGNQKVRSFLNPNLTIADWIHVFSTVIVPNLKKLELLK